MPVSETIAIGFLFLLGAALYASVGHGGASSYLAVMGLFSFAPAVMKPTALALNILVAAVATCSNGSCSGRSQSPRFQQRFLGAR